MLSLLPFTRRGTSPAGRDVSPQAAPDPSSMVDTLPVRAVELDRDGVVVAVNRAWQCSRLVVAGIRGVRPGCDYLAACHDAGTVDAARVGRGVASVTRGQRHSFALVCRDGSGRPVMVAARVIPGGGAVLTYEIDPTERLSAGDNGVRGRHLRVVPAPARRAPEAGRGPLRIAARSGAEFESAAWHDMTNLLVALGGLARLVVEATPREDQRYAAAVRLLHGLDDAAKTSRALGRTRASVDPRPVHVNHLLGEMIGTLSGLVGEAVELDVALDARQPLALADPITLKRAVLNLAANARDAMPAGGRLSLRTSNDATPGGRARVIIEVADTGSGMDDATLSRAFEPYFTTRGEEGTGLGLATVREAVEACGGAIAVESAPGAGTRFRLLLPAVDAGIEDAALPQTGLAA